MCSWGFASDFVAKSGWSGRFLVGFVDGDDPMRFGRALCGLNGGARVCKLPEEIPRVRREVCRVTRIYPKKTMLFPIVVLLRGYLCRKNFFSRRALRGASL